MIIAADDEAIVALDFSEEELSSSFETDLLLQAKNQLDEYYRGERKTFSLPLKANGTVFQERVWQALLTIPYAETRSYGEIAAQIGNPKASRAVGMANNRNPISIIIPCHRVIGSDGKLVGYGGGMHRKVWLLDLEKGQI
jgi:methylated-DNA-[protein]-cysteine S-methyltransferase